MKKFSTKFTASISTIALLFSLMPSTALALDCPEEGCEGNPTNTIIWFDEYLNGITDPGYSLGGVIPGDEINKRLKESHAAAKLWHSNPFLAKFSYYYVPGSMDGYEFIWLSNEDKSKMLQDTNATDPLEMENTLKHNNGIFRVPMRLRDLTKAMITDPKILPTVDGLFSTKKATVSYVTFVLEKNASNQLMWTITLTDGEGITSYIVKVSADNKQSPFFMVFKNSSPTIP